VSIDYVTELCTRLIVCEMIFLIINYSSQSEYFNRMITGASRIDSGDDDISSGKCSLFRWFNFRIVGYMNEIGTEEELVCQIDVM